MMTGKKQHGWLLFVAAALCFGTALAAGPEKFPAGGMPSGQPGPLPPSGSGNFPPPGGGNFPPPGGGNFSPPGGPGGPGSSSKVEVGSNVPPVGLRLVREVDVTPAGTTGVRPGLATVGGKLFVAYMDLRFPRSNQLVQLDADLKPAGVFPVAQGPGEPTDMRWLADSQGTMWSAYETVTSAPRSTVLNLSSYRVTADGVVTGILAHDIARGALMAPPYDIPEAGAEIVNDPTVFVFGGRIVLGTRRFERAVLPFRLFRPDGELETSFELDLSGMFPDRSLSVYSLVSIEGRPWLLAGAETSPLLANPVSDIYAVPLQPDLRRADGTAIPLLATPDYESYVCGARVAAGRLALVYNVLKFSSSFEGHLRVFDTRKGFTSIGHAQITHIPTGLPIDAHLSVELLGDRIFVAYYTPGGHLLVREYALETR